MRALEGRPRRRLPRRIPAPGPPARGPGSRRFYPRPAPRLAVRRAQWLWRGGHPRWRAAGCRAGSVELLEGTRFAPRCPSAQQGAGSPGPSEHPLGPERHLPAWPSVLAGVRAVSAQGAAEREPLIAVSRGSHVQTSPRNRNRLSPGLCFQCISENLPSASADNAYFSCAVY